MLNYSCMGFKENLKDELKYQGILVKELAEKSGVAKGTIDHYLAEKCTAPIAENAVKIAQALGVTVEYLVTGKEINLSKDKKSQNLEVDISLYKKYHKIMQKLDNLPENIKSPICKIIEEV